MWWRLRQGRSGFLLGPVLEELLGGGYVEGSGEQEALSAVAVLASELRKLALLLDALGDGLDRERLTELQPPGSIIERGS